MKKYIIVISAILIYFGFMYFVFSNRGDKDNDTNKNDYYIIFSNNIWKNNSGRFVTISNKEKAFSKKYNIYVNGEFFGKYNLGNYENNIYLFDDNNNSIKYSGEIFGTTKGDLTIYPLVEEQIELYDLTNASRALKELNINEEISESYLTKYLLDIDNDGIIENIYSLTNMFNEEKQGKGYSLIFLEDNNKINILISDVETNKNSFGKGYEYYINNIVDIDGDKTTDFIISRADYGSPDICYMLIQKQKKEYKITKSC